MEKSKLSVAFGYLAVLLGYLALSSPVQEEIRIQDEACGIFDLIGSVHEFIGMHESVDNKIQELEGLISELRQRYVLK